MEEDSIETIFVRPRNKFYVEYSLNGSESLHTKTYDGIKEYLHEIIPERFTQVNYALMRFQSFIISIPEKEFIFLQLSDMKNHYDDMENIVRNPTLEMAEAEMKQINALDIDETIKKISEL